MFIALTPASCSRNRRWPSALATPGLRPMLARGRVGAQGTDNYRALAQERESRAGGWRVPLLMCQNLRAQPRSYVASIVRLRVGVLARTNRADCLHIARNARPGWAARVQGENAPRRARLSGRGAPSHHCTPLPPRHQPPPDTLSRPAKLPEHFSRTPAPARDLGPSRRSGLRLPLERRDLQPARKPRSAVDAGTAAWTIGAEGVRY